MTGREVTHFREARGLTQAALARELGISLRTLQRWESQITDHLPRRIWLMFRAYETERRENA